MPVKLEVFLEIMESIAPKALAAEGDNCGLLIEPERHGLESILVALDPLPEVAQEAARLGADLVLTHHPLFRGGVTRISRDDPDTKAAWLLLRNGIGLFSAHTNLDEAQGGVNDALAGALGLLDIERMSESDPSLAPMRVGRLQNPETLEMFVRRVNSALGVDSRYVGEPGSMVTKAAVCGGSGMSLLGGVLKCGADAFVTADVRHHQALHALTAGVAVIDATHYSTERVVIEPLANRLQERFNELQYNVTLKSSRVERSVFKRA